MTIIAPYPDKSTPFNKVFPLHKEQGGKRFSQTKGKAMQANAACGMSLRSLPLFLLDLNIGHFSFNRLLIGVCYEALSNSNRERLWRSIR